MTYYGKERDARERARRFIAVGKVAVAAVLTAWMAIALVFGWWQSLVILIGIAIIVTCVLVGRFMLIDAWREFLETNDAECLVVGAVLCWFCLMITVPGIICIVIGVSK